MRTAIRIDKLILALVFTLSGLVTGFPKTGQDPQPAAASTPAAQMAPEDAARVLTELKRDLKLMPRSAKTMLFADPQASDCQGWAMPDGRRVIVESKGSYYGFSTGYLTNAKSKMFEMIGYLYSDTGFKIGDRVFESGGYAVFSIPDTLMILADGKNKDWEGYPEQDMRELPLTVPIDAALLDEGENIGSDARLKLKRPRHSIVQEEGRLFLRIGENKFALQLVENRRTDGVSAQEAPKSPVNASIMPSVDRNKKGGASITAWPPVLSWIHNSTVSLPSRSSPWPWRRRRPAAPANDRPRRRAS